MCFGRLFSRRFFASLSDHLGNKVAVWLETSNEATQASGLVTRG
jgi:hypothetical protein